MENIKLCEFCGKEHDGSYGSGRFCCYSCKQKFSSIKGAAATAKLPKEKFGGIKCKCKFCGEDFESKISMKRHLQTCEEKIKYCKGGPASKKGGWDCYCGENFRTRRLLTAHKKTCKTCSVETNGSTKRIVHLKYIDYICQFCKKSFVHKPINSKTLHEKQCWSNPNRIPNMRTGTHNSEESKRKTSKTIKKKIAEGSFIVPYKRNHSSKISYPEQYFIEVFKELPVEYNYQVGLYQLDFAIPEKKVYIEIDGEQHFVDKRIIEHDKERTEKLNALGWKCLRRIRWSEYQKLSQDDKNEFCKELIVDLGNC